ncbi:MAG: hypothetical protein IKH57_13950 [Clostridia bacterium]|nr:hypothetical protein [Clostridia bacterium]
MLTNPIETPRREKAVVYARYSSHNQREESIEGQLLHIFVAVAVHIQGESNRSMAQGFGERFGIDVALQGQHCVGVPLGYNNDKTGNPYSTRVLSNSSC